MATLKDIYAGASTATITLAGLANSGSVGRISSYVNNTSNAYLSANVYVALQIGNTAPTANTPMYVYLARSDNAGSINDDGNGTADAAGTFINTPLLGVISCASTGTGVTYYGVFDTSPLGPLGPAFGIGVVNNSGGSLLTGTINYIGITKSIA